MKYFDDKQLAYLNVTINQLEDRIVRNRIARPALYALCVTVIFFCAFLISERNRVISIADIFGDVFASVFLALIYTYVNILVFVTLMHTFHIGKCSVFLVTSIVFSVIALFCIRVPVSDPKSFLITIGICSLLSAIHVMVNGYVFDRISGASEQENNLIKAIRSLLND